MNKPFFLLALILGFSILILSCSKKKELSEMKPLSNTANRDIVLEGRYWRSMYQPNNAFELRFSNKEDVIAGNCFILINNKYIHEIKGLKGYKNNQNTLVLFEESVIGSGESITIPFNSESGNCENLKINSNLFFKPETISLITNNDTLIWQFNLPLKESFF